MEETIGDLHKQLAKKTSFESSVATLTSLFRDQYASASASEKNAMYVAACRAGTLLQSRYTGRGFWSAGQRLFDQAADVVKDSQQVAELKKLRTKAQEFLGEEQEPASVPAAGASSSFLFEGQLTTAPEPPPPAWLRLQNALGVMNLEESAERLRDITLLLDEDFQATLDEAFQAAQVARRPPASKEVVSKLPVVAVTSEVLTRVGEGTACAVCTEAFALNDEMQEMPCKHYFHQLCLKPWLEEHNSCPICRHELPTDDHNYESRKERERESEEERRGMANAVRDQFMYI